MNGENGQGVTNVSKIQPGPGTANNSAYTCFGSHVALNFTQTCKTRTCKYRVHLLRFIVFPSFPAPATPRWWDKPLLSHWLSSLQQGFGWIIYGWLYNILAPDLLN